MRPWSIEECEAYAEQLRDKNRACTAEHAAQAIEYLLGLVRREWVGLTEEDMPDGEDPMYDDPRFIAGMVWANNKLKEKCK